MFRQQPGTGGEVRERLEDQKKMALYDTNEGETSKGRKKRGANKDYNNSVTGF